jgi:hypothetical protein
MPDHSIEPDPEYLDTPYLTAAVNICTALGVFIGIWTAIFLAGDLRHGFARYWSLVLILVIDLSVNVGVRVARSRKMREQYPDGRPRSARRAERRPQSRQVG